MSLNRAMMRVGAGASAAARGAIGKPTYGGAAFAVMGRRNMTTFTERERGEETVYMRREDQRLLHNLLQKEKAASASNEDGKAELKAILGEHKLPNDVIEKLLAWKSA